MHVVLRCPPGVARRARYVLDTLLMPLGIATTYADQPPAEGPWLLYAATLQSESGLDRAVAIAHRPDAWRLFDGAEIAPAAGSANGLALPLPGSSDEIEAAGGVSFDLLANAFYFLSSWEERATVGEAARVTYATSVFHRLDVPQDIVDRYQAYLMRVVERVHGRLSLPMPARAPWPGGGSFAVVLSHDVDFVPAGLHDMALQGAKSIARALLKYGDLGETVRVCAGLARAAVQRRDPYGCIPEILARETALGVRSSFQVAVGHRHPADVNYVIENDRTRDYLRTICDSGFDLCLHGSYRSAEDAAWYVDEVELLARRLRRPIGSRQHFLSFAYDRLFRAQEMAGIEFDMSMGFPDRPGPRAGFSFPYFPYCLDEDRPYRVLQISLFLMDVTLRGYLRLRAGDAAATIDAAIDDLGSKGGCASVVWHPIVFGAARDPGFDALFWRMIDQVRRKGGSCVDGATINAWWRARAASWAGLA